MTTPSDRRLGSVVMPGLLGLLAVLALSLFTVRATGCSHSDAGLPVIKQAK